MKFLISFMGSIITVICLWGLSGCGQADKEMPFQYNYLSPAEVAVQYNGVVYHLRQTGTSDETPFDFQFESDGDVDITLEGKTYEIDSPYDEAGNVLKKLTKKTKKTSKKSTSRKRK